MVVRYAQPGAGASDIAASIEARIADGSVAPGAALPPVRALATELAVNPNTVAAAYRMLRDRGVVETAGRRGTRVRPRPSSTPRWQIGVDVPASARDVSTGGPDPRLLPRIPASTRSTGSYGQPDVHADLAAAATRRLSDDGVPVPALGVVSSALDAVERVLRDHLRPGDRIAVEDPGWGNLLDLVAALGLTPEPVRVDDDGPVPADLERALRRGARAAVVTSRAQNPTGAAIGAARARALRAVLRGHPDVVLIEDDHAAEVSGVPLHPVVGARTGPARWAFVRSAGKVWGPDLRVAVVVGDETTIDRVRGRLRLGPGWVSHLLQAAVADLWADPGAERTVARARVAYASRRAAVLDALADRGVAGHGRSGLNVWVPVPDETSAVTRLLAHGWAVAPGARFRLGTGPAVRITVADLGVREARELAAAVADAVRPTGRPAA